MFAPREECNLHDNSKFTMAAIVNKIYTLLFILLNMWCTRVDLGLLRKINSQSTNCYSLYIVLINILKSEIILGFPVTSRRPCWCTEQSWKKSWNFDFIIMQNVSDILPLFCTPTWPSHHVSENQQWRHNSMKIDAVKFHISSAN